MRIDPKLVTPIGTTGSRERRTPASDSSPPEAAAVVSLSVAGAAVASGPSNAEITARIDKLRAAIAKGDYPIDLDALASRIVDDELVRG